MKYTTLGGAVAACLAFALPALAQTAGTYAGTSADGNGVQFTVATDTTTGALAVTGALVFYTAPCKRSTLVQNSGWGYGLTADIANGMVSNQTYNPDFDITFNLTFSADGTTATGNVSTAVGVLNTAQTKPRSALFCSSAKQAMTVTLQSGGASYPAPAGGRTHYDRTSR